MVSLLLSEAIDMGAANQLALDVSSLDKEIQDTGRDLSAAKAELATAAADAERLSAEHSRLKTADPNQFSPTTVLARSDQAIRETLARILQTDSTSAEDLHFAIRDSARSLCSRVIPMKPPSYERVLKKICKKFKVPAAEGTVLHREQALLVHFFNETWKQLSDEQRSEFRERLESDGKEWAPGLPNFRPEILTATGIVAAQASGFGVYLAASTVVGAITNAAGIALPFAFYTGMSSTIALIIGPAGWVALGVLVLSKLFGPKYRLAAKICPSGFGFTGTPTP